MAQPGATTQDTPELEQTKQQQPAKVEPTKAEPTKDIDGDVPVKDADEAYPSEEASKVVAPADDDTTEPVALPPSVAPDLTADPEDEAKTENFQFNADFAQFMSLIIYAVY
eukprot:799680_1